MQQKKDLIYLTYYEILKSLRSKAISKQILEEKESRREWMINRFEYAGRNDRKIKEYKFWKEGNEAKEIHSNAFLDQKINYIHMNPVVAEIVKEPEDYLYSSAIDYSGGKGLLDIILAE